MMDTYFKTVLGITAIPYIWMHACKINIFGKITFIMLIYKFDVSYFFKAYFMFIEVKLLYLDNEFLSNLLQSKYKSVIFLLQKPCEHLQIKGLCINFTLSISQLEWKDITKKKKKKIMVSLLRFHVLVRLSENRDWQSRLLQ